MKYFDGGCSEKINTFVDENAYGTHGLKRFEGGKIRFETTNPSGKVIIGNGNVGITR